MKKKDERIIDLLAITYLKCKEDQIRPFEDMMQEKVLNNGVEYWLSEDGKWQNTPGGRERCVPLLLGTTVGHYDFVLVYGASSAYVVTQFCIDILRNSSPSIVGAGTISFGDHILDTNTTIAVSGDIQAAVEFHLRRDELRRKSLRMNQQRRRSSPSARFESLPSSGPAADSQMPQGDSEPEPVEHDGRSSSSEPLD